MIGYKAHKLDSDEKQTCWATTVQMANDFYGYIDMARNLDPFSLDNEGEVRRLRGEEETFFSDYKSLKWIIPKMITVGVSIYILATELNKLGE